MTPVATPPMTVASDVSVADALAIILATLHDVGARDPSYERVPLAAALGRVLAA